MVKNRRGRPPIFDKSMDVKFQIRISEELRDKLHQLADSREMTASELFREWIEEEWEQELSGYHKIEDANIAW